MNRVLLSGMFALGLAAAAAPASAFCRSLTCGKNCPVDGATGCPVGGTPIAWAGSCPSYSIQQDGSASVPYDQLKQVADFAFRAWWETTCPSGNKQPSISVRNPFGETVCGRVEYNAGQANANIIVMRDPWEGDKNVLALTTVTTNTQTGEIYDADMEINGTQPLSVGGVMPGRYDLRSIITHEAGHFLGLAHSNQPGATMSPMYSAGNDDFSTLEPDDINGICAIYPTQRNAPECDPSPRRGFSPECALDPARGGSCSLGITRARSSARPVTAFALALGVAVARLRPKRRAQKLT